jgi:hypothetical protein
VVMVRDNRVRAGGGGIGQMSMLGLSLEIPRIPFG